LRKRAERPPNQPQAAKKSNNFLTPKMALYSNKKYLMRDLVSEYLSNCDLIFSLQNTIFGDFDYIKNLISLII